MDTLRRYQVTEDLLTKQLISSYNLTTMASMHMDKKKFYDLLPILAKLREAYLLQRTHTAL